MSSNTLIIEPFYGGSHKQLIDFILNIVLPEKSVMDVTLETLPDKKWHWRARTSALHFAQSIRRDKKFDILFCSSVLNLAELVALRPDLAHCKKIVYFHENQLAYPVAHVKERDFQYGYNQILTSLVADVIVFNSQYNRASFLSGIRSHMNIMPDCRPKEDLRTLIEPKSQVTYFPVLPPPTLNPNVTEGPLHIVWAHRWEHDKNPEAFFDCLRKLHENDYDFRVSVLGQTFTDVPSVFEEFKELLRNKILNWGYLPSKEDYWKVLHSANVAVSTANHEFFGVSMIEAGLSGCYPLVPKRLSYVELFPPDCLYNTDQQLYKKLRAFCKNNSLCKRLPETLDLSKYTAEALKLQYNQLFS